ncbi:unnamed protein product [Symbiodinium sp. CCMP2592]|nr:unnamed protein product [Symbiodinium sp. CCMP2592]
MTSRVRNGGARGGGPPGLGVTPVPGTVELPGDSSDEDLRSEPGPKRRQAEGGSPAKKKDSKGITLGDIQQLLENQSRVLQDHQTTQIREAVAELRESTTAQFKKVRDEVARHGDYIEQLRDQGDKPERRIEALEARGGQNWGDDGAGDGQAGKNRKNLIIFGGWGPDAHRDVLLPELKDLLQKVNLLDSFEDIFTTGPRRGNALGLVSLLPQETDQALKRRLTNTVQPIRGAQVAGKSMEHGKNLWAALSKSKIERLRSSHAGKLKRLVLEINEQEKSRIEVEWNAGSVWLGENLIGSCTRAKPTMAVMDDGKTPGSWELREDTELVDGVHREFIPLQGPESTCEKRDLLGAPPPLNHDSGGHPSPGGCVTDLSPETDDRPGSQVTFFSWIIGGKPVIDALTSIENSTRVQPLQECVIALQELPRASPGWKTTTEHGGKVLLQYRDDDLQWRGNGILFDPTVFQCLRRKACKLGIWAKLRHRKSSTDLWVASARLSTGVTDDITAQEIQEFLKLRPPLPNRAVLLADFNTQLKWASAGGSVGKPQPTTGRADYLTSELETRGYQLCPPKPPQWDVPTSRPRRRGARGRQIDGVAVATFPVTEILIESKSYEQIGGDHDRLHFSLLLSTKGEPVGQDTCTRPRQVCGEPGPQSSFTQATLEDLARRFTRPSPGKRYRDPAAVKQLYRTAKRDGGEQAWKEAHKARRMARDLWHKDKVTRASTGGWKDFRDLQQTHGQLWAVPLSEEAYERGEEPLRWTINHFKQIFAAPPGEPPNPTWDRPIEEGSPPFSKEELLEAIAKGKNSKSVGLDLTSYELLRKLVADEPTLEALLLWLEEIRKGQPIPEAWLHTVVTLLPKTAAPESPSDLRPISLGSTIGKVFGQLLLRRTREAIRPVGPEQCAHSGRQTCDYLGSAIRIFQLETEWKWGLHWVKLDISKAFDSLSRSRALTHLKSNLPDHMYQEYHCWERLLAPGVATIRTPWGEGRVSQTRGIRQGAVESPWLFGVAMECALHEAQNHPQWPRQLGAAPDLSIHELLFMDDSLSWSGNKRDLGLKYHILREALSRWGLQVNPKKTAYYQSPYVTEKDPICLDGVDIEPSSSMEVMGVVLQVPLKPSSLLNSGLAKARKKYFASRHIFECRGPLKERLKTFQMAVGGAALWYAAAAPPSPQALGAANALQQELVARMAGFKRRPDETWLEHRLRSFRAARQLLHNHGQPRWSTSWLKRYWGYRGHVARSWFREAPPASAVLDRYRTYTWWRQENRIGDGIRHPTWFFPHLTGEEQKLNRAAGRSDWREAAVDTAQWRSLEAEWLRREDVRWTSGRQVSLTDSAMTPPSPPPPPPAVGGE